MSTNDGSQGQLGLQNSKSLSQRKANSVHVYCAVRILVIIMILGGIDDLAQVSWRIYMQAPSAERLLASPSHLHTMQLVMLSRLEAAARMREGRRRPIKRMAVNAKPSLPL